ncbi:MAG: hypothetical protein RLT05_19485 [Bauldia litoralis]
MSASTVSPFLRKALLADAAISGATGLLLALAAGGLADLLGVPAGLPRWAGIALLPFAALLAFLATRERLARPVVWAVIAANLVWAVDSILLLFVGWIEPTVPGVAFIVAQAAVVAVFAELQWLGLRRSAPAAA